MRNGSNPHSFRADLKIQDGGTVCPIWTDHGPVAERKRTR